jgi:hypothetical protein
MIFKTARTLIGHAVCFGLRAETDPPCNVPTLGRRRKRAYPPTAWRSMRLTAGGSSKRNVTGSVTTARA